MKKNFFWALCILLIGVAYFISTADYDHSNNVIYYGGDQPQYEADPLSLASTAVNRQTEAGSKINAKEGISVWEALKSVTINVAWQLQMEDKLGSIEKGKYADLVILNKNPLKIAPEQLSSIQILETIVAGNTIWSMH